MKPQHSLMIVLSFLIIGGLLILIGKPSDRANLSGVMEIVGDAQKVVTKPVMIATRVSPAEEMQLGKELSAQMALFNAPNKDIGELENYVTQIGKLVAANRQRREISYDFHVLNDEAVNAFALPGGQIFVFKGLIGFVETEAELAAILGHEITHVDDRHCVELFQAELAAKKISKIVLGNPGFLAPLGARFISRVMQAGYQKYQEFQADADGFQMAVTAGYDPEASESVFTRLREKFENESKPSKAGDPVEELGKAILVAAGSYFHSHPPTQERIQKLQEIREKADLKNKTFYRGRENLKSRKYKNVQNLPDEIIRF